MAVLNKSVCMSFYNRKYFFPSFWIIYLFLGEHYEEKSSIKYLPHIVTPVLMVNAKDDPIVPAHTLDDFHLLEQNVIKKGSNMVSFFY